MTKKKLITLLDPLILDLDFPSKYALFSLLLVLHTFLRAGFSALVASTATLLFFSQRNPRALSHSFFSFSSSAVVVVRGARPPPPPPSPEEQAERASGQSAHAASHEFHEARPLARVSVRTTACVQCVLLVCGRPCEHTVQALRRVGWGVVLFLWAPQGLDVPYGSVAGQTVRRTACRPVNDDGRATAALQHKVKEK